LFGSPCQPYNLSPSLSEIFHRVSTTVSSPVFMRYRSDGFSFSFIRTIFRRDKRCPPYGAPFPCEHFFFIFGSRLLRRNPPLALVYLNAPIPRAKRRHTFCSSFPFLWSAYPGHRFSCFTRRCFLVKQAFLLNPESAGLRSYSRLVSSFVVFLSGDHTEQTSHLPIIAIRGWPA